jgi:hypothetical protein
MATGQPEKYTSTAIGARVFSRSGFLAKVTKAYLLVDGTLDEYIREFMAKPAPVRHLYEIHTAPQPPLVTAVLSGEHIVELARLRDFL